LESSPLAPAIVALAFSRYPKRATLRILCDHFYGESLHELLSHILYRDNTSNILDIMAKIDSASARRRNITSPKRLAVAVEAILEWCLSNQADLRFLSMYSAHRSWLQRTKPGKHIATGAPRLASVFHVWCIIALDMLKDPYDHMPLIVPTTEDLIKYRPLTMVVGPKYSNTSDALWRQRNQFQKVAHLLEALLWLLPKAGFSEKIVRYSKRTFQWNIYQRKPCLIHRVRKCLDEYNTRVQNAKLQELGQRISNGELFV
jgi:hypothetical protein